MPDQHGINPATGIIPFNPTLLRGARGLARLQFPLAGRIRGLAASASCDPAIEWTFPVLGADPGSGPHRRIRSAKYSADGAGRTWRRRRRPRRSALSKCACRLRQPPRFGRDRATPVPRMAWRAGRSKLLSLRPSGRYQTDHAHESAKALICLLIACRLKATSHILAMELGRVEDLFILRATEGSISGGPPRGT